jgi:hypothetical protein
MYIRVTASGDLSLQNTGNMRSFSIVEDVRDAPVTRLAEIGTPTDDNHYWLDAHAVLELSGRKHDQQWVDDFWNMLASVAAYGSRRGDKTGESPRGTS